MAPAKIRSPIDGSDAVVSATHTKTDRALVDYLGGLKLHGGDHDGAPLVVLPWERRMIRGVFRQPGDGALTVARGNGKSAIVAGIAAAVVDPAGAAEWTAPGGRVLWPASFEQGPR